jgi:hypothetical protein
MTAVAMRVLVVLGYLLGATDPVDGEAIGRASAIVAGLIVTLFLFYLALSGPTMQLLHSMWRRGRRLAATTAQATTAVVRTTSSKPVVRP